MLFFLLKSLEYVHPYFSKLKKHHYINTCSENDKTWFIDYFWTATYLSFEKIKNDKILHFDNYCTLHVLKCKHSWMYIVYVPISDQKYFWHVNKCKHCSYIYSLHKISNSQENDWNTISVFSYILWRKGTSLSLFSQSYHL